jgi:hypothetical protein
VTGGVETKRDGRRLLRLLEAFTGPRWLPLLVIFLIMWVPFLAEYGWRFRNIPNTDLPSLYTAAVSVFEQGESPYDPSRLREQMDSGIRVYPYLYPPPSLLFFSPLAALSYDQARLAVLIVNHALLLLLIWVIPWFLLRLRPERRFPDFAICLVYPLAFYPAVVTLNHGQVNFLLLTFLLLFWLLARRRRALWAGLFLALAIVLKTYPLILVPALLLIGRWKVSLYSLGWTALAGLAALLVLPGAAWHDWVARVIPVGGYMATPEGLFAPGAICNQSLNGLISRYFVEGRAGDMWVIGRGAAGAAAYVVAALILLVTGFALRRARYLHADCLGRAILVVLPAMYLVAPFSWEHHLVYLLPCILLLLTARTTLAPVPQLLFYALVVGSAILVALPVLLVFKFLGVLVLWGLGVYAALGRSVHLVAGHTDRGGW